MKQTINPGRIAFMVAGMSILVGLLSLAILQSPWAAALKMVADKHKEMGMDCSACHKESPPKEKVSAEICMGCHGDAETMANRTKNQSPNYHAGKDLNCILCHSAHK
jgi:hypothetical protein